MGHIERIVIPVSRYLNGSSRLSRQELSRTRRRRGRTAQPGGGKGDDLVVRGVRRPAGTADPAVGRRIARCLAYLLSPFFPIDQPFWIDRRSCTESEEMRSVNIS
jgi:hypothetical protein